MPPKSIMPVTANAEAKCEQCGYISILTIYHRTDGRKISCCTECYENGTDDTYTPSEISGSSDLMSDEDSSTSEKNDKVGHSGSGSCSDSD
jgi:hypothetical protein